MPLASDRRTLDARNLLCRLRRQCRTVRAHENPTHDLEIGTLATPEACRHEAVAESDDRVDRGAAEFAHRPNAIAKILYGNVTTDRAADPRELFHVVRVDEIGNALTHPRSARISVEILRPFALRARVMSARLDFDAAIDAEQRHGDVTTKPSARRPT
jgi:hypothetical protein